MKKIKKITLLALFLSTAFIAGCQAPSNTLTFSTPSPTAVFNTQNQSAYVNVVTQDLRSTNEIANYVRNGETHRLTSTPEVAQLFQQAMLQNLNSKGFSLIQGAANAHVTLKIKRFFADVNQGNLRYRINANVELEIAVQGKGGYFNKNFATERSYKGAFNASNQEIQKVLEQAYTDAIKSIYNDNEIAQAIHQFK